MLCRILSGPPHHEFFASLELGGGRRNNRRTVDFTIQPIDPPPESSVIREATTWPAMIDGADREDGSGTMWNFRAWMLNKKIKGFYDTVTRTGTIEIPA